MNPKLEINEVLITGENVELEGALTVPADAAGIAIFAHGSGSSRHSPRNQAVARGLRERGIGTLLFDLLMRQEEEAERFTRHLRFDIPLLASRLALATRWVLNSDAADMPIGYFGSSTGAAAALVAAADFGNQISAVVSRGGRPDLAYDALERVVAPTLMIVGGLDDVVLGLNEEAYERMQCERCLKTVPGATHLFEEPGALERVTSLAADWFADAMDRALAQAP